MGVGLVAILVTVSALTLGSLKIRRALQKWKPTLEHAEEAARRQVGEFCERQRQVSSNPFFEPHSRAHNAGTYLSARLGWEEGLDGGMVAKPAAPNWRPLPKALVERMKSLENSVAQLTDDDLQQVDTTWLEELTAFDHWELTGDHGPLTPDSGVPWASFSLPRMADLPIWAKLHLARALRGGELEAAARTVRHVAWLCYSTESMLGAAMANALLVIERRAYLVAQARGLQTGRWKPWTEEETAGFRGLLRQAHHFANASTDDATFEQAFSCGTPPVARCWALTEIAPNYASLKKLIEDDPWKGRVSSRLSLISKDDGQCRFELARFAVEHFDRMPDAVGVRAMSSYAGLILLAASAKGPTIDVAKDAGEW